MCTPTYIYGRHIKHLIVENFEFQLHEARKFSITTEAPAWYIDLVEKHELLKKVHVMQCKRRETITNEVRHMVLLIVESKIAGTYEEASLFALFKSAALLGTQCGDEADLKCIQAAIAIGWMFLSERLRLDDSKEGNRIEIE
jgi:hypothetical protein